MEYLTTGLLLLILGNMIYLERTCATLKTDVKNIKDKVNNIEEKKEEQDEQNTTSS
jgi:hypothetical protein